MLTARRSAGLDLWASLVCYSSSDCCCLRSLPVAKRAAFSSNVSCSFLAYVSYLIYFLFHSLSLSLVFTYVADGQQLISLPFLLRSPPIVPYGAYAQQSRNLSLYWRFVLCSSRTSDNNFRLHWPNLD